MPKMFYPTREQENVLAAMQGFVHQLPQEDGTLVVVTKGYYTASLNSWVVAIAPMGTVVGSWALSGDWGFPGIHAIDRLSGTKDGAPVVCGRPLDYHMVIVREYDGWRHIMDQWVCGGNAGWEGNAPVPDYLRAALDALYPGNGLAHTGTGHGRRHGE